MGVWNSPLQFYQHQKRAFQSSTSSARQQWRQIPEGGYRDLKEGTSGSISSRELARMGHPYARRQGKASTGRRGVSKSYAKRNPGVKAPLLPINRQSSRLHDSVTLWHRSSVFTLESSVGFDGAKAGNSLYAVAPRGTPYVVPRGIWGMLRTRGMARSRAWNDTFFRGQRTAFSKP